MEDYYVVRMGRKGGDVEKDSSSRGGLVKVLPKLP